MTALGPMQKRRSYHAPNRLAAAEQTRRRICQAAGEMFLSQGYATTSIRTIALAAAVAEKTVYLQFASKSALLRDVVESAIAAQERSSSAGVPSPGGVSVVFHSVLTEPDPAKKVPMLVTVVADLHQRTGPLFAMLRAAAAVDPDATELWDAVKQGTRADVSALASNLQTAGLLPPATDTGWATAVLFVLLGPESWQLVRGELGMSDSAYREWLRAALDRVLISRGTHPGRG